MFQYKSNDTNFTQYNQVLIALFVRSNFALKYVCALFLEKEVVVRNSAFALEQEMTICFFVFYAMREPPRNT
jgi:hypothetical protein